MTLLLEKSTKNGEGDEPFYRYAKCVNVSSRSSPSAISNPHKLKRTMWRLSVFSVTVEGEWSLATNLNRPSFITNAKLTDFFRKVKNYLLQPWHILRGFSRQFVIVQAVECRSCVGDKLIQVGDVENRTSDA